MNNMQLFDDYKEHLLELNITPKFVSEYSEEFLKREPSFKKEDEYDLSVTGEMYLFREKQTVPKLRKDYYQDFQLNCESRNFYFYETDSQAEVELGTLGNLQYAFVKNDSSYFQESYACRNSICYYSRDYAEIRILLPEAIDHVVFSVGPGISRVVLIELMDNSPKPIMLIEKLSDCDLIDYGSGPELGRFLWSREGNSVDMPNKHKKSVITKALS